MLQMPPYGFHVWDTLRNIQIKVNWYVTRPPIALRPLPEPCRRDKNMARGGKRAPEHPVSKGKTQSGRDKPRDFHGARTEYACKGPADPEDCK